MKRLLFRVSTVIILGFLFLGIARVFIFIMPINSQLPDYLYEIEGAFPDMSFSNPVGIYSSPDDTNRLFVLEQKGKIYLFKNTEDTSTKNVFLDITDRVLYGGEQGLLGLEFHPNFTENGYFYLNYVADDPRRTVIACFSLLGNNPNLANVSDEVVLLEIQQPYANHNGRQIAFGPSDGYLYIALGDGGSAGDPFNNAQNLSSLLGSILRIDVNTQDDGLNYGIPPDNPFVGNTQGFREEIFVYGLRNPWRFSFDSVSGRLWAADVGQNKIEEIDIIHKGNNYGWRLMEGSECYNPSTNCNTTGLTYPIYEYTHDLGNSISGGFVYRGSQLKGIYGYYIYANYGSGRIWALEYTNSSVSNYLLVDSTLNIVSFGVDNKKELFICAFDGRIHKLKETLLTSDSFEEKETSDAETPGFSLFTLLLGIPGFIVIFYKRRRNI
jgi:glucose/arabinose dehydrogenase